MDEGFDSCGSHLSSLELTRRSAFITDINMVSRPLCLSRIDTVQVETVGPDVSMS